MNHPKTLNREIRLNIDMLQGHVTATCSSDKIAVRKWEIACGKEKSLTLCGNLMFISVTLKRDIGYLPHGPHVTSNL